MTIDAGSSGLDASVDITWNEGVVGLVLRYQNEASWLQMWYDSFQQKLKVASFSGGLTFFADTPFTMIAGVPRHFDIVQTGDNIQVTVDSAGSPIINTNISFLSSSTEYGIFDFAGAFGQGTTGNFFDNYSLK